MRSQGGGGTTGAAGLGFGVACGRAAFGAACRRPFLAGLLRAAVFLRLPFDFAFFLAFAMTTSSPPIIVPRSIRAGQDKSRRAAPGGRYAARVHPRMLVISGRSNAWRRLRSVCAQPRPPAPV